MSIIRLRPVAFGATGVLLIAALPSLTGVVILSDLVTGSASPLSEPADAARRAAYPAALWLHILGGAGFGLLGLLQFSARLRRRWPGLHRWSGRVLVTGGAGLALSGLWMNVVYPNPIDSLLHDGLQTLASVALLACLALGVRAILRRQIAAHRGWMMRAYALCLGAGTQTLLLLPLFLIGQMPPVLVVDMVFGGAWLVNLAVAEWLIRRRVVQGSVVPPLVRTQTGQGQF